MKLNSFFKLSLAAIVVLLLIALTAGNFTFDKANASPGGSFDYVQIWGMSQSLPGLPMEAHVILFDSRNGNVWAYSDKAMVGKAQPSYIGKLAELGKPIMKKQ